MRKVIILTVLVLVLAAVAMPFGFCATIPDQYPGYYQALAAVTLDGTLRVSPRLILSVNGVIADAKDNALTVSTAYPTGMVLGDSTYNYPDPGVEKIAYSTNTYFAKVYSNDEWAFFICRTPISCGNTHTVNPVIEYSANGGTSWANFPDNALSDVIDSYRYPTHPINDWIDVGNFQFRARFGGGTEPQTYSFTVGFVAYQE